MLRFYNVIVIGRGGHPSFKDFIVNDNGLDEESLTYLIEEKVEFWVRTYSGYGECSYEINEVTHPSKIKLILHNRLTDIHDEIRNLQIEEHELILRVSENDKLLFKKT